MSMEDSDDWYKIILNILVEIDLIKLAKGDEIQLESAESPGSSQHSGQGSNLPSQDRLSVQSNVASLKLSR